MIPLCKFVEDNYVEYGKYVNTKRIFPGQDGLLPVTRRLLLTLGETAKGKLMSTALVVGYTSKYHPFGSSSVEGVIDSLAMNEFIDSKGARGSHLLEYIPAAASRYTKSGLTNAQYDYLFKLKDYHNIVEGEEIDEPEYLILPVPFILEYGSLGNMGLGIAGSYPAFTAESLIAAHLNDDYKLLVPQYKMNLVDSDEGLKNLWETGEGSITQSLNVTASSDGSVTISGMCNVIHPSMTTLNKLKDDGKILISNESSDGLLLRIKRVKGAHGINDSELLSICKTSVTKSRSYSIKVVVDGSLCIMPIKDWMDLTVNKFLVIYNQYIKDRLLKLAHKIEVASNTPVVGKLVLDNKTNLEIQQITNLKSEVIESILSKSINSLRKTNYDKELASLGASIELVEKEDALEELNSILKREGK
jgi:hypothetical protein